MMNRSLPAALAIFAAVCGPSIAHADLDSLLGEWAAAATQDAGNRDEVDLSLLATDDAVDAEFNETRQTTTGTRATAKQQPPSDKILASHSGQAQTEVTSGHGHQAVPVMANPQVDLYAPSAPTINPYCVPATTNCDCKRQTGTCGYGGGCGELIATNQACHCEGESECRPHRRPLLPPPSTILQMFRSKNSYSTVWAGYADETRTRLRNTSPDLNGTWNSCDNGGLIEPNCNTCDSGCSQ